MKYLVLLTFLRIFAPDNKDCNVFMKYIKWITNAYMATACLSLSSCFKEELPNAECDIEEAYIHVDNPEMMFENLTDTLVKVQSDQTSIVFTMAGGSDVTALAPQFRLTEGATIQPESGSVQDFSNGPVTYVVTSEDKKWTRTYTVSVASLLKMDEVIDSEGNIGKKFDFENYSMDGNKYYSWYEPWQNDGKASLVDIWATGNPGFNISNPSSAADDYPTIPESDSYDGKGVKLVTRRTSGLADMVKKPIAAGNLFIGKFDPTSALQDAMKATKFGLPFSFIKKPETFSGYYKYQAGETYTDKNFDVMEGKKDKGTIYAVLYDNHDSNGDAIVLYGDNVQTSEQVVALARLNDIDNTSEWTSFSIPFEYKKDVDMDKLLSGGYSLAIVCSSSYEGALFNGAVGSTLYIDKFTIVCK